MAEIYRPQKKDPLEQILTGVQLAAGILNIKGSLQDMDIKEEKRATDLKDREEAAKIRELQTSEAEARLAEQKRIAMGKLNPHEEAQYLTTMTPVDENAPGAVRFISSRSDTPIFLAQKPKEVDPMVQKNYDRMIAQDQSEAEEKRIKKELDNNIRADNIRKEFVGDKKTLVYQDGYEIAQDLRNLLTSKKAVLDAIALRKVFKISGDVGSIRSEDLEQLGASPALVSQLQAIFGSKLEGRRIEGPERRALTELAVQMELNNKVKLEKHAKSFASRISKLTTMTEDEAYTFLEPSKLLFDVPVSGERKQVYDDMGDANASFDNMSDDEYLNYYMGQ